MICFHFTYFIYWEGWVFLITSFTTSTTIEEKVLITELTYLSQ